MIPLDGGWLFGGRMREGAHLPGFDDSGFEPVTLPHSVARLPWHDVDRSRYEGVWIYRRHLTPPAVWTGKRAFVSFEGAMCVSKVYINGTLLGENRGSYTPFCFELTGHLVPEEDNLLSVVLDTRRSLRDVPPFGGRALDFDTFGGIHRGVSLEVVPDTFVSDVFVRVGQRGVVEALLSLDGPPEEGLSVRVLLLDGGCVVAEGRGGVARGTVRVPLCGVGEVERWDVEHPRLYEVEARLMRRGLEVHRRRVLTGFREARFTPEGFFLNGRRLQIRGLNRHELFPHVGGAMPARIQRKDAEILKRELGCNMVRCSHYPQSEAFLDACDELGLLVWEEMPGWHHVGGRRWRAAAAEGVRRMILRDRNRPSVVVWGVRVNESDRDHPGFFASLNRLAHGLDGTRQTAGAYHRRSHPLRQDVFGHNDYSFPPGPPHRPLYLVSEAVGQKAPGKLRGFRRHYRRTDPPRVQTLQAMRHARAHEAAAGDRRIAGVLGWCAFDYNSPVDSSRDVKSPGVCDVFRIPKPGAAFYRAQRDITEGPVIEPAFYWCFGPETPDGPGGEAPIFSNCERLEVYMDGEHHSTLFPDRSRYGNLPHPPFFADLRVVRGSRPELEIDGYVGARKVASRVFSADEEQDRLTVSSDDAGISGDGSDATRVVFCITDRYGNARPRAAGEVVLDLEGPGEIIGENPFDLGEAGGAGAVWVRGVRGGEGVVRVRARCREYGEGEVRIQVHRMPEEPGI